MTRIVRERGDVAEARRPARVRANGTVVTSLTLDEETYGQVRARAERDGTSFAEQIRLLIEWGLMADEEGGR